MIFLTPAEIGRLSVLKAAREMGIWPRPAPQTFAERHGIVCDIDEEPRESCDRIVYRCTLRRVDSTASMVIRFQATAAHPEPPTADEVLRWLAMSWAHLRHANDLAEWESMHFPSDASPSERYPYRGIVRSRSTSATFYESLRMETRRFFAFLGQPTFEALMVSIDAAG